MIEHLHLSEDDLNDLINVFVHSLPTVTGTTQRTVLLKHMAALQSDLSERRLSGYAEEKRSVFLNGIRNINFSACVAQSNIPENELMALLGKIVTECAAAPPGDYQREACAGQAITAFMALFMKIELNCNRSNKK